MPRTKISIPLPPLAFGGRSRKIDDSVYEMRDRLQFVVSGLQECESIADHGFFQHHSSLLSVNGMKMAATAGTPVRERVKKNGDMTILFPFSGQGNLTVDGRMIHWQSGVNAALLPYCSSNGESSLRSILMLDINPKKLDQISHSMLGIEENSHSRLDYQEPRKLNLHIGRLSFETIFRQLANLLDQFALQPEMLNKTGIDNNIYRNLAVMLKPELFLEASNSNKNYARRLLDRVCEYAQAHLSQSITMTELERVSNMSTRNLHYAFLKRYDTTPMRWVRTERLIMAHNYLNSASPGSTITAIALSCGFNKPAAFADYYFKHFGELPSATLARTLAR
jgi:AraC-like DNA-binding protein